MTKSIDLTKISNIDEVLDDDYILVLGSKLGKIKFEDIVIDETQTTFFSEIQALRAQVDTLQGTVDDLNNTLKLLATTPVSGLSAQLDTLFTTLSAKVDTNTADIATNTANILANTNNITNNTVNIAQNATDIATNAAAIAILGGGSGDDITSIIASTSALALTNSSKIVQLSGAIDSVNSTTIYITGASAGNIYDFSALSALAETAYYKSQDNETDILNLSTYTLTLPSSAEFVATQTQTNTNTTNILTLSTDLSALSLNVATLSTDLSGAMYEIDTNFNTLTGVAQSQIDLNTLVNCINIATGAGC